MRKPLPKLIGVIHLPPLPGSPGASKKTPAKALQDAISFAVREAGVLTASGFEGIILENFGDAPFFKTEVKQETIAAFAVLAQKVRDETALPLGINVLRNDAFSALAIAAVIGADFIRVNVLSGVVATDQGMIEGRAADLIRERIRLNAEHVAILADVHVKHAKTLSSSDLSLCIEETAGRGGADGVIVTGDTTGRAPDLKIMNDAFKAAKHAGVPLFIGSGMTPELLKELSNKNIGVIVGSALRSAGIAGAPLDLKRTKEMVKAWKARHQ